MSFLCISILVTSLITLLIYCCFVSPSPQVFDILLLELEPVCTAEQEFVQKFFDFTLEEPDVSAHYFISYFAHREISIISLGLI